ncbi:MAG: 1-deoxy-D-xylulose-5-phosphate reductoisomerase [Candidatus Tectomicrobia bacterium]|uniref:1-deoxy-D-xylulose 5-phosphate reductoisomerase n=1 Tax=Tectimicrobiota bacterium TaxID=2528274 RepID=A0A932CRL8_UNCTE|nr:1-deoxy-D-xylulose-5-phosphate reductoisomerase [Candidatus Tectomicrobia bacterium]
MKKITILGSTGSIGLGTLDVVRQNRDQFQVVGLGAHRSVDQLERQAREFRPAYVALYDEDRAGELETRLNGEGIQVWAGPEGMERLAALPEVTLVVSAIVGAAGLIPTLAAIEAGKDIALANKEVLVMAGELVLREAAGRSALIPIDSEHSAIFQALAGEDRQAIRRLLLTGSGGPFRNLSREAMGRVKRQEALRHPNWQMGEKITIDCATLMNKGFEVIEAKWLFGVEPARIQVLIHPQSIVHSLVEFQDGSLMAQLGPPDMRLPIAYALTYSPDRPHRLPNTLASLDLAEIGSLTFDRPDLERFPCLRYAYQAIEVGGTMPAVLNAADEVAVQSFLREEIRFLQIPQIIAETLRGHLPQPLTGLNQVLEADRWGREMASHLIGHQLKR